MIYIYSPKTIRKFFLQVMTAFSFELKELGYNNKIVDQLSPTDNYKKDVAIIFGFHNLGGNQAFISLIKNYKSIVYNSEQLHAKTWIKFMNGIKNIDHVWDYSQKNVDILKQRGITNVYHIPLGYSKAFCVPNISNNRDYKTMHFFGYMNSRRRLLINKLRQQGVLVNSHQNMFDAKYNQMLQKHGLYINIHYPEKAILELFRIVPLLSNDCAVLSEKSDDQVLDKMYEPFITFFNPQTSPQQLKKIIKDAVDKRQERCDNFKEQLSYSKILRSSGCLNDLPQN